MQLPAIRWVRAACALAVLASAGCYSYVFATNGGRREARRECLAAVRAKGQNVVQIGDADWRGSGKYEVLLTVATDSTSRTTLKCNYDFRNRATEITVVTP